MLDPNEGCDTAIGAGLPGACEFSCLGLLNGCAREAVVGTDCQQHCGPKYFACGIVDGCCAPGCTTADDGDCGQAGCYTAPWKQYRHDASHQAAESFDDFTECGAWANSTVAPQILWSIDLNGPIWNSPGLVVDPNGGQSFRVASGDFDAGITFSKVWENDGGTEWSLTILQPIEDAGPFYEDAGNRLDAPGWATLTSQGDLLVASSSGAIHLQVTESDAGMDFFQTPGSTNPFIIKDSGIEWLVYIDPDGIAHGEQLYVSAPTPWIASTATCNNSETYLLGATSNYVSIFDDLNGGSTSFSMLFETPSDVPGAPVCSTSNGRVVGSPAFYGNVVYLATSVQPGIGMLLGFDQPWANPANPPIFSRAIGDVFSPPVVDSFGQVYVGEGAAHTLHAFSRKGFPLWKVDLPTTFDSPAVTGYGTVLVGGQDGILYCVKEGAILWTLTLGGALTSPIITVEGYIAIGSSNGQFYLLRSP